ncbi:MAG TPA: K(+)-transporting ATPase subunit C [Candidatus Dormibacteraeota bacterium]|jgi:K+-transporting ATPase ATPase C chain|nr:K(+)-transporting ATPase subunit C [Candidatus Dormibacteraeota bacterium]
MLKSLPREILIAIRLTLVFAVVTGLAYPLAITGVGQVLFHDQANGSLISDKSGQVVGSRLIGQWFDPTDSTYFHPRPSATVDPNTGAVLPYAANNSSGSNLGPSNQTLINRVQAQVQQIISTEQNIVDGVPVDMVTTSFSGLDPDISVANADLQAKRVAAVRGIDPAKMQALVDKYTQGRVLGLFGEPHVNVLLLNMALDNGEAG